jgi:DNA repair exonuclease SbcCD nuclease subunit
MTSFFSSGRRNFLLKLSALFSAFSLSGFSLSGKPRKLRFAIASDGHYGQPNTSYDADHQNLIQFLNDEKKNKGLDFCVFNGDLIHDKIEFLPQVKQIYDKLACKYYVTRGNHDHASLEQWKQTWGYDTNHAFESHGHGFLLLDNSDEQGKYICAAQDYTQNQLKKFANLRNVFVFMHISPRKWTEAGIDCPEINAIMDKTSNVKAIFHGHDHKEDTKKVSEAGKNHFWDAHFGGNWGTSYKGYRIVEVETDGSVYTYQFDMAEKKKINEDRF